MRRSNYSYHSDRLFEVLVESLRSDYINSDEPSVLFCAGGYFFLNAYMAFDDLLVNGIFAKKPYFQYKMCVFGPNFYHKVASINLFYYKPMNCNSFCVITKIKLIIERVTWSKIPKNCKKHIFF